MIISNVQILSGVKVYSEDILDTGLLNQMQNNNLYLQGKSTSFSESPHAVSISNDGTYLYTLDSSSIVRQYLLDVPFYPELGASLFNSFSAIVNVTSNARGLFINPDGSTWYIQGTGNSERIFQYSMTESGNIASSVYDNKFYSVTSQDSGPTGITLSSDGKNLYVAGGTSTNRLFHYRLGTAWQINTASYTGNSVLGLSAGSLVDITIPLHGNSIISLDTTYDDIIEHNLQIPFELGSYYSNTQLRSATISTHRGICFSPDGKHLYVAGDTDISHYTTGETREIFSLPKNQRFALPGGVDPSFLQFNANGEKLYVGGGDAVYQYSINNFSIDAASYDSISVSLSSLVSDSLFRDLYFKPDGSACYTISGSSSLLRQFNLSTPFDLSSAVSYSVKRLSSSPSLTVLGTTPGTVGTNNSIYIGDNGKRIYFSVSNGTYGLITVGAVLNTPWDLESIRSNTNEVLDYGSEMTELPRSIFFNSSGTRFYCLDDDAEFLLEYSLIYPWILSSARYTHKRHSLSSLNTSQHCVTYEPRSNKIYMLGQAIVSGTLVEFNV